MLYRVDLAGLCQEDLGLVGQWSMTLWMDFLTTVQMEHVAITPLMRKTLMHESFMPSKERLTFGLRKDNESQLSRNLVLVNI